VRRFPLGIFFDVVGITVIIMSFLFPFHFFMPAWNQNETTLQVEPYGNTGLDLDLYIGGIIRGSIQISGANSTALSFIIEDSTGETITSKKVEKQYNFEFSPKNTGLHKLLFDNTVNADEPKTISITVRQYYYNVLFLCIGFGIFLSGIILIITASEQPTQTETVARPAGASQESASQNSGY